MRRFRPTDLAAVIRVYRDAARITGRAAYPEAAVRVWARFPEDPASFAAALAEGDTLCLLEEGNVVAFGQRHPRDHIALLYTDPAHGRRGHAARLLKALEALAVADGVDRLRTEASRVARSLFARLGYRVIAEEHVRRRGVAFQRFRMVKTLRT